MEIIYVFWHLTPSLARPSEKRNVRSFIFLHSTLKFHFAFLFAFSDLLCLHCVCIIIGILLTDVWQFKMC